MHWRETTRGPGLEAGSARPQRKGRASIVIAAGGDRTVRAVARGMAGSGVRIPSAPAASWRATSPFPMTPHSLAVALDANYDTAWVRVEDITEPSALPAERTAQRCPPSRPTALRMRTRTRHVGLVHRILFSIKIRLPRHRRHGLRRRDDGECGSRAKETHRVDRRGRD